MLRQMASRRCRRGLGRAGRVIPARAVLKESRRVLYEAVTDRQAPESLSALARLEGVGPALESTRAAAWVQSTP